MLGVISNPQKKVQIDLPKKSVVSGIENIKVLSNKYDLVKQNPLINQFTFSALEFLSAGVYIDIEVASVNENISEVTVEVRRKIGSFDRSHEVTQAHTHISTVLDLLNQSLTTDISSAISAYSQQQQKIQDVQSKIEDFKFKRQEYRKNNPVLFYAKQALFWVVILFLAYVVFMYYKNN